MFQHQRTHKLHRGLNYRSIPVLDAFAAICVKKGHYDVAAVALKPQLPKIELFPATNDELTPEQEDVRRILKKLSHLHFHGTERKRLICAKFFSIPGPTKDSSLSSTSYIALPINTDISSSAGGKRNIGR